MALGTTVIQVIPEFQATEGDQIVINETLIFNGGQIIGQAFTPPAFTGTVHNYDFTGLIDIIDGAVGDPDVVGFLRVSSTVNMSWTGFLAPAIVDPEAARTRLVYIKNVGTKNIILKDNDAGSDPANRWDLGSDKTIQGGEGILIIYDDAPLLAVDQRWSSAGLNI